MALKTVLFLAAFIACSGGALYMPLLGILGYIGHYDLGPERKWWGAPLNDLGLRYSYTLALMTAIGIAIHWRSLRYGKTFFAGQEKLLLLFLGAVWFSTLIGEQTEFYTVVDHPAVKMTKIVIFVFMMTHVVTTEKYLNVLLWALVLGALSLGWQAYTTPYSHFQRGRLEGVGGHDFSEANFLAAYLATMLPLIGIQFLRSRWLGKLVCLIAGAFTANAIVLTRSRGAFVGLAAGTVVATLLAPKQHRTKIMVGLVVATLGWFYVANPAYWHRVSTITTSDEQRDASAESRLEIWQATIQMISNHPLGVGAGNFFQSIGQVDPRFVGRDTHNTFLRCAAEVGVQGIGIFLALIAGSILSLRRLLREARLLYKPDREFVTYMSYGVIVSLTTLLACGMTVTLVYTEFVWWILALPMCIQRVVINLSEDRAASPTIEAGIEDAVARPKPLRPGAALGRSGVGR
jgi:O-antigen ligase